MTKIQFLPFHFENFSLITMESRIIKKTLKILKLSKKQLNYQNNLALITILTSSTLPPTKLNIVLNVIKAIEK